MASNTDTLPSESTAAREKTRPPRARPPSRPRRVALGWAAVITVSIVVAALAVASFTGGDDHPDIRASRLAAEAEESEREAHLAGQAETYGGHSGSTNPTEADNRAAQEAEESEREAHLTGQAKTYDGHSGSTNPTEAGNRASQKAEAERYVDWLEDRVESSSTEGEPSSDGFVPGSRHMPMQ